MFRKVTGMMINASKSCLVINMVQEEDLQYMIDKFPFQSHNFDDGIKYLGFYLKPNDYKKADWRWLIGKL